MTPSFSSPRPLALVELLANASADVSWLWDGYLARGGVSLLTNQWKAGKTTLLAVLLARLKGGGVLGGCAVRPGRALVLTEEEPALWCQRSRSLDLQDHVSWLCRPFLGKPTREQWQRLLDDVLALRGQAGLDLFVIDPLAAFLPGADENHAPSVLAALAPLRRLTSCGMAVLLLHHPRKAASADGRAARGSGALSGFYVLIEMGWRHRASATSRVRRLRAWSRYQGTPADLLVELSAEGTDYVPARAAPAAESEADAGAVPEGLRLLLEDASDKLTRQGILAGWLPDFQPAPDPGTLHRWLARAGSDGAVCREGSGRRGDPFRYWLPQAEERWRQHPCYELKELAEAEARRWRAAYPEAGTPDDLGSAEVPEEAD